MNNAFFYIVIDSHSIFCLVFDSMFEEIQWFGTEEIVKPIPWKLLRTKNKLNENIMKKY